MTKSIGSTSTFRTFSKRSHNWSEPMNEQIIRTATTLHGSCLSKTTPLPSVATQGDTYINPSDKRIHVWVDERPVDQFGTIAPAEWYAITATSGFMIFVIDERTFYIMLGGEWVPVWNLDQTHRIVEKELTLYAPGRLRAAETIFKYCAGTEFTIPQNAPGSGATLDVAASAPITYTIRRNGSNVGTIAFGAGQTDGVVSVPNQVVVHAAAEENMYVRANTLTVDAPADVFGAQGLSFSIKGMIRSIDQ